MPPEVTPSRKEDKMEPVACDRKLAESLLLLRSILQVSPFCGTVHIFL